MGAFLTRGDVERLTKRKRFSAQCRQLERLGISYRPATDGEPLVSTDALDVCEAKARNNGPHWDRIAG